MTRLAIIAWCALSTTAWSQDARVVDTPRRQLVCDLGRKVLKDWLDGQKDHNAFVDDSRPRLLPAPAEAPAELRKAWSGGQPAGLFETCPELRSQVTAPAAFASPDQWAAVKTLGGGWLELLRFSAPILDPAGKRALISIELSCPGLCGTGGVSLYGRRRGQWIRLQTGPWPIS